LREAGLEASNAEDVVALARSGQAPAILAVREAGKAVGHVLAGLVSSLNPAVIFIGGEMAQAGETLLAGIREVIFARSLPAATNRLRIATCRDLDAAAILGAARLVQNHLFGLPAKPVIYSTSTDVDT
jgi:glucokinase